MKKSRGIKSPETVYLKACAFSGQQCGISIPFWLKYNQTIMSVGLIFIKQKLIFLSCQFLEKYIVIHYFACSTILPDV
jgi:hypothetical protein